MVRMEGHLIKTRSSEVFNKQFQYNVNRAVPADHQERDGGIQGP
jgi:hypothetical protein